MSKESFDKFFARYQTEREEIIGQLENSNGIISNLSESISQTLQFALKLATVWAFNDLKVVEGLQKLVFPEGIYYNKKTGAFRTPKVNFIFRCIADRKTVSDENKKGTNHTSDDLSL